MRNLDNLILSGHWEIEPLFALQTLAKYWYELDLVENGHQVDYSAQRAALEPVILGAVDLGRGGLSSPDIPRGSIVKLSLSGAMRLEDGLSSRGVRQLIQDIRTADENPNISGILIEVNSGGGESIAGGELQNALEDVKRGKRTKIGVYAQEMASAALRAMVPADFIYASSGNTFIGSIGTLISVDKTAIKWLKKNILNIYASQSTKKNEEYRALLDGDTSKYAALLTEHNQVFIDEVRSYRKLKGPTARIKEVFEGKLFTAEEALQVGLIDGIGTFGQAVERLQSMLTTPGNGTFNNLNSNTMTYKSIMAFLAALIPGLNARLGMDLSEDATADDVIEAVNGAKDLKTVKAELKAELATEQDAKMAELSNRMDELTARVETLQTENTRLTTERDALTEQVQALTGEQSEWTTARAALEAQVADLKGKRGTVAKDGTSEQTNSSAPNIDQFKTVQGFGLAAVKPEGSSKY